MNKRCYIFLLLISISLGVNAQQWTARKKLLPQDSMQAFHFSSAVAVYENFAISGAPFFDSIRADGNILQDIGAVYIYSRNGNGEWEQRQKITAPDAEKDDNFGNSVAIYENYLAIGAEGKSFSAPYDTNRYKRAGVVYLYQLNAAGKWEIVQQLQAHDKDLDDNFGSSVAIHNGVLAVGAKGDNKNGINFMWDVGSVYIFRRQTDGSWLFEYKVIHNDMVADDYFGSCVALENNTLLVGAYSKNENTMTGTLGSHVGAVYLFEYTSGIWIQKQKLTSPHADRWGFFGADVDLSGNYAIIAAPGEHLDSNGLNYLQKSGAAYIYEKQANGQWQLLQKITDLYRDKSEQFGRSVAISGDNILVGANCEAKDENEKNIQNRAGAAYIFIKQNNGRWSLFQKIAAYDRENMYIFGNDVDISDSVSIVSAFFPFPGVYTLWEGAAYIFEMCSSLSIVKKDVCEEFVSPSGKKWRKSGIYYDTLTNILGCDSILKYELQVDYIYPELGEDVILCEEEILQLDAGSEGAEYRWQDGSRNQFFDVTQAGKYWVEVRKGGCVKYDSIEVYSHSKQHILPNIITPNHDGVNDNFLPVNDFWPGQYQLRIYNREGREVFADSDYKGEWNASGLSAGIYYYILYFDGRDCRQEFKGFFHLVK